MGAGQTVSPELQSSGWDIARIARESSNIPQFAFLTLIYMETRAGGYSAPLLRDDIARLCGMPATTAALVANACIEFRLVTRACFCGLFSMDCQSADHHRYRLIDAARPAAVQSSGSLQAPLKSAEGEKRVEGGVR